MHDAAQSQSNCGVLVSSSQGLSVKNPSLLSARQANLSSSFFSPSSSTTFSSVSSSISHFLRLFLHASLHSISPSYSQIFLTPSIDLRIQLLDVDERVRFSRTSLSNDAPLPPLRSVGCLWSLHHNRFPTLALRKWISIADYFFTLVESRRFLCSHTSKTGWSRHDKSKVDEPRCYTIKIVCVFLRFHSGLRDFLFAYHASNNGTASFSKSSAILVTHKHEPKCSSERFIMVKKKEKLCDLLNPNQARINIVTMRIQPTFL